jgi:phosphohistidine phosphatase
MQPCAIKNHPALREKNKINPKIADPGLAFLGRDLFFKGGNRIMALYLVQHGKSLPKDKDPQKGLSEEGVAETKRIAEVAKGYKVPVAGITHSGKTRARQTAEILAKALEPGSGIDERSGLSPLDDVADFAGSIDSARNRMFVGHLPFMERLTAYLITGSIARPVFKFQNSGIVCLDMDPDSRSWVIRWSIMPHIT